MNSSLPSHSGLRDEVL